MSFEFFIASAVLTFGIECTISFLFALSVGKLFHIQGRLNLCFFADNRNHIRNNWNAIWTIDQIPEFEIHNQYICGNAVID